MKTNKCSRKEQESLLYRHFNDELKKATIKFVELGLMTKEQKYIWDKLPLKSGGIGERYYSIGLGKLV